MRLKTGPGVEAKYEEGLQNLSKACSVEPQPFNYFVLACGLEQVGLFDEAKRYYELSSIHPYSKERLAAFAYYAGEDTLVPDLETELILLKNVGFINPNSALKRLEVLENQMPTRSEIINLKSHLLWIKQDWQEIPNYKDKILTTKSPTTKNVPFEAFGSLVSALVHTGNYNEALNLTENLTPTRTNISLQSLANFEMYRRTGDKTYLSEAGTKAIVAMRQKDDGTPPFLWLVYAKTVSKEYWDQFYESANPGDPIIKGWLEVE